MQCTSIPCPCQTKSDHSGMCCRSQALLRVVGQSQQQQHRWRSRMAMPLTTLKQSRRRYTSRTWRGRQVGTASRCSCAHVMVMMRHAIDASGATTFDKVLLSACCR